MTFDLHCVRSLNERVNREHLERLAYHHRIMDLLQSQRASLDASLSVHRDVMTAVEQAQKLTQLPFARVTSMIEQIKARELEWAQIYRQSLIPAVEAAMKASQSMERLSRTIWPVQVVVERLGIASPSILDQALRARIAEAAKISSAVSQSLANLEQNAAVTSYFLSERWQNQVGVSIERLIRNYESLCARVSAAPSRLPEINPIILQAPPVELYQSTALLRSFCRNARTSRSKEAEAVLDEARDALEEDLAKIDERFVVIYRGAKNAVRRMTPDHVRHFSVSLRELITLVIHALSPDDEFHCWNRDPSLVRNGKPTRKGRLLYICRFVNHDGFSKFVDTDIRAAIEFIDLFQEGTHGIEAQFTRRQLRTMLRRAEALLSYLLEIEFQNRSL